MAQAANNLCLPSTSVIPPPPKGRSPDFLLPHHLQLRLENPSISVHTTTSQNTNVKEQLPPLREDTEFIDGSCPTDPALERIIDKFESITTDAVTVQREVLRKILEENKEAQYLIYHGLNGRTDAESFKKCVPLATYPDLKPYVDRIYSGENAGVLTSKPVTALSLSSGTSEGKPKRVPFTEEMMNAYVQSMITSLAYRNREYPIDSTKMFLQLIYTTKKTKTDTGLDLGLVSTHIITNPKYTLSYLAQRCSPDEVITASDPGQALYCHLLMGLKFRTEIQYVYSVFAHTLVNAFRTLEQVWPDICRDILVGTPDINRVTDPDVREAVSARLGRPDPDSAQEIYGLCEGLRSKGWEDLVPVLFPNAKYLLAVMTGTAEHYLGRLRIYAGNVPLKGVDYGSTEGWVGTNVRSKVAPEDICFVPIPDIAYFEFIPLDEVDGKGKNLEPVGLTDVKVGHKYELVFTNFQGMYRYRLGDWVKVTGFYNSTPELRYICRGDVMLSINIDKITEKDIQAAVEVASRHLTSENIELVDFTSQTDTTPDNEHYIIYWEMSNSGNNDDDNSTSELMGKCCNSLDAAFEDLGYVSSRRCGSIGALELRIVRSGSFKKIADYMCSPSDSGSGVQFKMPRCVKSGASSRVVKMLVDNVIGSYFSTTYDQ